MNNRSINYFKNRKKKYIKLPLDFKQSDNLKLSNGEMLADVLKPLPCKFPSGWLAEKPKGNVYLIEDPISGELTQLTYFQKVELGLNTPPEFSMPVLNEPAYMVMTIPTDTNPFTTFIDPLMLKAFKYGGTTNRFIVAHHALSEMEESKRYITSFRPLKIRNYCYENELIEYHNWLAPILDTSTFIVVGRNELKAFPIPNAAFADSYFRETKNSKT